MPEPDVLAVAVEAAHAAVEVAERIARKREDCDMVTALADARDALASIAGRLRRRAQEGS